MLAADRSTCWWTRRWSGIWARSRWLAGAAVANVAAQAISAGLFIRALVAERVPLRAGAGHHPDPAQPRSRPRAAHSGVPGCFISATAVAAHTSTAAVAGHQVVMQLWMFGALLLDSLAIAAQSLIGAALGADDRRAAMDVGWRVSRYGLIFGTLLGIMFAVLFPILPGAFTSDGSVLAQIPMAW